MPNKDINMKFKADRLHHPKLNHFVIKGFVWVAIALAGGWLTWALIIGRGSIFG